MKSQWMKLCVVIGAVAIAGLYVLDLSWAQAPSEERLEINAERLLEVQRDERRAKVEALRAANEAWRIQEVKIRDMGDAKRIVRFHSTKSLADLRQAAEQVRDAKDEDARAKAQANLNELLSSYFEEDMEQRQKELVDVEERLQKLRAQLERRRAKKQDIIDLQVNVLLNEAEGLGFFSNGESATIHSPAYGVRFGDPTPPVPAPANRFVPAVPPVPSANPAPVTVPAFDRDPYNSETP